MLNVTKSKQLSSELQENTKFLQIYTIFIEYLKKKYLQICFNSTPENKLTSIFIKIEKTFEIGN